MTIVSIAFKSALKNYMYTQLFALNKVHFTITAVKRRFNSIQFKNLHMVTYPVMLQLIFSGAI